MADDGDKWTSRHAQKTNEPARRLTEGGGDEGRREKKSRWDRRDDDQGGKGQREERDRYSSGRRHGGEDGREFRRDRAGLDSGRRADAGSSSSSPSNKHNGRRERTTRSRSPTNFARDRAKERDAYTRRYGLSRGEGESRTTASAEPESSQQRNDEPDFGSSGLLAKESNSKNGVTLKYFEPPEGRKPKKKWRLYTFLDGKEIDVLHISRQSCYLLGRDLAVADIPIEHVSVSKQHAVIQYRSLTSRNEFGDEKRSVKPFMIDLESANGTFVNGKEIPPSRYYELKSGDAITIGGYDREMVLLMED